MPDLKGQIAEAREVLSQISKIEDELQQMRDFIKRGSTSSATLLVRPGMLATPQGSAPQPPSMVNVLSEDPLEAALAADSGPDPLKALAESSGQGTKTTPVKPLGDISSSKGLMTSLDNLIGAVPEQSPSTPAKSASAVAPATPATPSTPAGKEKDWSHSADGSSLEWYITIPDDMPRENVQCNLRGLTLSLNSQAKGSKEKVKLERTRLPVEVPPENVTAEIVEQCAVVRVKKPDFMMFDQSAQLFSQKYDPANRKTSHDKPGIVLKQEKKDDKVCVSVIPGTKTTEITVTMQNGDLTFNAVIVHEERKVNPDGKPSLKRKIEKSQSVMHLRFFTDPKTVNVTDTGDGCSIVVTRPSPKKLLEKLEIMGDKLEHGLESIPQALQELTSKNDSINQIIAYCAGTYKQQGGSEKTGTVDKTKQYTQDAVQTVLGAISKLGQEFSGFIETQDGELDRLCMEINAIKTRLLMHREKAGDQGVRHLMSTKVEYAAVAKKKLEGDEIPLSAQPLPPYERESLNFDVLDGIGTPLGSSTAATGAAPAPMGRPGGAPPSLRRPTQFGAPPPPLNMDYAPPPMLSGGGGGEDLPLPTPGMLSSAPPPAPRASFCSDQPPPPLPSTDAPAPPSVAPTPPPSMPPPSMPPGPPPAAGPPPVAGPPPPTGPPPPGPPPSGPPPGPPPSGPPSGPPPGPPSSGPPPVPAPMISVGATMPPPSVGPPTLSANRGRNPAMARPRGPPPGPPPSLSSGPPPPLSSGGSNNALRGGPPPPLGGRAPPARPPPPSQPPPPLSQP